MSICIENRESDKREITITIDDLYNYTNYLIYVQDIVNTLEKFKLSDSYRAQREWLRVTVSMTDKYFNSIPESMLSVEHGVTVEAFERVKVMVNEYIEHTKTLENSIDKPM